ncbi:(2Fe-2S)-binding protein [Flavobacteriales bacterium 34_180_T64]|nr:(2Fe-2S)-binding protein [Flavobacteriales bacterium 34_180_T64]
MIEFILNNKTIKTSLNSGMTLSDFIRYEQRLTGTKIGCREGDCGACTVLIGTLKEDKTISYQSITSCISPLGNAHGKHVVTIEGMNLQNRLNSSQLAMKSNYATQCGFCTPGFIVSLTGFALSKNEKTNENALNAISGNICRCTGYKSIEKAASEVCSNLNLHKDSISLEWLIDNYFIPKYFKDIPGKLNQLTTDTLQQNGTLYISGGTDLYVQQADNLIENDVHLIAENNLFKGVTIDKNECILGSNATVTDLWNNSELNTQFPNLRKYLKLVSSEQIRNMASFGGNIVNASPIGDMTIFLLALNSNITISNSNDDQRSLLLNDFYQGYKTYDLKDDELISSINFKIQREHSYFNFEKVSKRTHLDISSVNSAISLTVEKQTISEAHVSIGGVAAIPKYLHQTSEFLKGKNLNTQLIIDANEILQTEISPISDVRGSSNYKRLLARQLFYAHFTELFPELFTLNDFVQYA